MSLLINGKTYDVPGVKIIGPHQEKWAHLNAGDGKYRTNKPTQWVLHKTLADDPEVVIAGAGPAGGAERTATNWDEDPHHSGATLVTGHDGVIACLEDLWLWESWHGNQSNDRSVGHETCEKVGGGVYEAALKSTVAVTLAGTRALGIQWQCPDHYRSNTPLPRYHDGGSTLIGIFGHRYVSDSRGRWDPGEELYLRLHAAGVEMFDFYAGQDRDVWGKRQRWLNSTYGTKLAEDGLPGPATTAALAKLGWPDGIWALRSVAGAP